MKVLSLFSGIVAFEKALDNLHIPYELVGFCEIDKYAEKSYCAIHGVDESMNLGDITKIDATKLPRDIDLVTYGFPCQDISLAGKQKGLFNEDGSQTRSGLFFESLRIIEETQPKIAIAENVKNLVGKKFNAQFQVVLASLEAAGYNNYWSVLNAKNYGVPQNRERVFIVSIRKDIDTGKFEFPKPFTLEKRLKDVLEEVVDEKYYLSDTAVRGLNAHKERHDALGHGFGWNPTDGSGIATTIQTKPGSRPTDNFIEEPCVKQIANLMPSKTRDNPNQGRLYDKDGLSPTLGAMQGGNRQPFVVVGNDTVMVREATKQGFAEASAGDSTNLEQPNSTTRRGRVGKQVAQTLTTSCNQAAVVEPKVIGGIGEKKSNGGKQWYQQDRIYDGDQVAISIATGFNPYYSVGEPVAYDEQNQYIRKDGTVGTIMTDGSSPKKNNRVIESDLRIRKLTPKECFRLMGFDDESYHKAEAVNSNTQLYKQAGNSIVVDVLEELFCQMFDCRGRLRV